MSFYACENIGGSLRSEGCMKKGGVDDATLFL